MRKTSHVTIGDKMEKNNKWQTFEISLERIFIEKETKKAYLFRFEIGYLKIIVSGIQKYW